MYINSPGSGPILGASLRKLIKIKALVVDIVLIGLLVPWYSEKCPANKSSDHVSSLTWQQPGLYIFEIKSSPNTMNFRLLAFLSIWMRKQWHCHLSILLHLGLSVCGLQVMVITWSWSSPSSSSRHPAPAPVSVCCLLCTSTIKHQFQTIWATQSRFNTVAF